MNVQLRELTLTLGTGIIFGFGLATLLFNEMTLPSQFRPYRTFSNLREVSNENNISENLYDKVRILCWVMTSPSGHSNRCQAIKDTWGRHCNKLIFMSSQQDLSLGAIALPNVSEGRGWLWGKTKESFKYIWRHHRNDADWFFKADDDTFAIIENLRHFLAPKNPFEPTYYGCRFKSDFLPNPNYTGRQGFMSGGAGYVLSKEAVRKFVEEALNLNDSMCSANHNGAEDTEIAHCLTHVGVKSGDSRDEFGRLRFLPLSPDALLTPNNLSVPGWYFNYSYYHVVSGFNCCSDSTISFHYVAPKQMRLLYQLTYFIRPYGYKYREKH